MHEFTPEVLYGDTVSKKRAYDALSRDYAANGNTFAAVHAAFASDVQAVQSVMWERVMVISPQPDEQFRAIGSTVSKALAVYAASPMVADNARGVVEAARQGMFAAFDAGAQSIIVEAWAALDHLDGLPAPTASEGANIALARTQGEPVREVSRNRRQAARDCMAVAVDMERQNRRDDAMQQAWQADWATFESYLLDAAIQVGDQTLITVEMRWALASLAVSKIPALPADFREAVTLIRASLLASLGTIEGQRLKARFEDIAA